MTVGNMKALFAQATFYSSSRIRPQAVAKSPSRPWQSRWAAGYQAPTFSEIGSGLVEDLSGARETLTSDASGAIEDDQQGGLQFSEYQSPEADGRKHEGPFCPSDALFVKPNQATSSRQIAFPPVAEPLGGLS
jgi:hypothetical protein